MRILQTNSGPVIETPHGIGTLVRRGTVDLGWYARDVEGQWQVVLPDLRTFTTTAGRAELVERLAAQGRE